MSPSGKVYIGQAINISRRFAEYSKLTSCASQIVLYRSFVKYGVKAHTFVVLRECEVSQLNNWERHYQDLYNSTGPAGLNCRLTGSTCKSGKMSKESILKRQQTRIRNGTNIPTREVVERRANTRRGMKIGPQRRLECPHCGKVGGISNMKRLHFERCSVRTGVKHIGSPRPFLIGNTYASVNKGKSKKLVVCPACGQQGGHAAMMRWHFDNCKKTKNTQQST